MALSIIGTFALIVAILSAIKLIVILTKPKAWYDYVVENVYAIPILTMIISAILAITVLYYLLGAGITIIQIFAVMLFLMLIMTTSFAAYSKDVLPWARKMLKDGRMIRRAIFPIIIWILLTVWVLYELFT